MAINSISPGSYNSPSVQPQTQTDRAAMERQAAQARNAERTQQAQPAQTQAKPTVNTSGQTVGTLVNTKA